MPNARELSHRVVELAESGQFDKALDLVNKGIKVDGNNANVWYNKGIILFKMCRYQDALNALVVSQDRLVRREVISWIAVQIRHSIHTECPYHDVHVWQRICSKLVGQCEIKPNLPV
ncbi:MAG: tetratricopeptide repeat protein [Methanoregula sp.]|nr:tetratricopeptide repeat protein [Methanoregula sp.]